MTATPLILTKHFGDPESHTLRSYLATGGYEALRKALTTMKPEEVVEEVKKSNLRGLGGAGFPCGVKWSFMPKEPKGPHYLVVNADEGEPGTCKDQKLLLRAPHMLLEGIAIGCYAIRAKTAWVYIRGEYVRMRERLEAAIREAREAGWIGKNVLKTGFDVDVVVHPGAGAYICGEETALLESLEGKKGWPRLKPPFPAQRGAFGCPTSVNNVETLCHVPHIIRNGAEWFAAIGTPKHGGTRLYSITGHVERPGVYEAPVKTTLRELIDRHAGGVAGGRAVKAVIPGGSSAQVLTASEIDVPADFEAIKAIGSMAGSGGVIVMDDRTCMVRALYYLIRFYAHESCGQCSPCREGTGWAHRILTRILKGSGRPVDVDTLKSAADNFCWTTICPLAPAAAFPVQSFVTKFRSEFDHHALHGTCDVPGAEAPVLPDETPERIQSPGLAIAG